MNFLKDHILLAIVFFFIGAVLFGSIWYKCYINSIQEADYKVLEKGNIYEVRLYESFLVAQTNIRTSDFREGGNQAFNILAGYIFGGNVPKSKIAMTTPVFDNVSVDGERIFSFILPSQYTLETLPVPNDGRVVIKEVPSKKVAVRSFSGRWNKKRFDKQFETLKSALEENNVAFSLSYTRASYDPPLVPWFLRKNEIQIELLDS